MLFFFISFCFFFFFHLSNFSFFFATAFPSFPVFHPPSTTPNIHVCFHGGISCSLGRLGFSSLRPLVFTHRVRHGFLSLWLPESKPVHAASSFSQDPKLFPRREAFLLCVLPVLMFSPPHDAYSFRRPKVLGQGIAYPILPDARLFHFFLQRDFEVFP